MRHISTPQKAGCAVRANSLLPCHPVLILTFADVSQHSHESGLANPPRCDRRAQAAAKSTTTGPDPSMPPAFSSQSGGPCLEPNQTTGQMMAQLSPTYASLTPLSFDVHATPPRVRRCHLASRLLFCACARARAHPYPCAASLSCVYSGPSGCCQ